MFLQFSLSVSISESVCSMFFKFLACRHSDALDVRRFVQTRFLFTFKNYVKQEKEVRSDVMGLWVILTVENVHGIFPLFHEEMLEKSMDNVHSTLDIVHGFHGHCPHIPWIPWTLSTHSMDSMDNVHSTLEKFHGQCPQYPGHCPWIPWTLSTHCMDSMDIVHTLHGFHGQCPQYPGKIPWTMSTVPWTSMDSMDNVHTFHGFHGHCPHIPWIPWTMSIDSVENIHGKCPGCPWNPWTFFQVYKTFFQAE